jgi:hypothetical protein
MVAGTASFRDPASARRRAALANTSAIKRDAE